MLLIPFLFVVLPVALGANEALEERISRFEDRISKYADQLDQHTEKIESQQAAILDLVTESDEKTIIAVGFTAKATSAQSYETGDVVQFPDAMYNVNLNYNPATSVFTCAYHGLYLFHVAIYCDTDENMSVDIVHNNNVRVQAWKADTIQSDHASVQVVLECLVGEEVEVRALAPGILEGYSDMAVSTFSGALISQM